MSKNRVGAVTAVLAAGVIYLVVLVALAPAQSADSVPPNPAGAAPPASKVAPSPSSAKRVPDKDLSAGGARGQLEEMMSFCDVTPPCPASCNEDAAAKMCVDKTGL